MSKSNTLWNDGSGLGELANEVNDALRQVSEMEPLYERIKALVDLAESNPNYRLAVVDDGVRPVLYRCQKDNEFMQFVTVEGYRRVVKMGDK